MTPSPANLSPKTLERLKQRLLEEQERLLRQAEELAAEAEQLARDRDGGDTQFDEESGEGDTVNVERERDLLLSASARQDVDEIDEALVRMKTRARYGVCRYAGPTPPARAARARCRGPTCASTARRVPNDDGEPGRRPPRRRAMRRGRDRRPVSSSSTS